MSKHFDISENTTTNIQKTKKEPKELLTGVHSEMGFLFFYRNNKSNAEHKLTNILIYFTHMLLYFIQDIYIYVLKHSWSMDETFCCIL